MNKLIQTCIVLRLITRLEDLPPNTFEIFPTVNTEQLFKRTLINQFVSTLFSQFITN